MSESWFVIRCITGWEVKAAKALRKRGYVVNLPCYRKAASRYVKRKRSKLEALYRGYLFVDRMPWIEMDYDDERCLMNRRGDMILLRPKDDRVMRTDQSEIARAMEIAKKYDRGERRPSAAAFSIGDTVAFDVGQKEMQGEVVACSDIVVMRAEFMGRTTFVERPVGAVRTVRARLEQLEAA